MLGIETKLLTLFHPQTDGQTKQINQELEQYLQFFIDYRQKNQLEWLAIAKFTANNKVHSATKVFLFMENYGRELRIRANIRRKEKVEKTMKFPERMKKIQKKVGVALKKAQEEMRRQVNKERKEAEEQKKKDQVMLSIKDLVFKKRLAKKLVD